MSTFSVILSNNSGGCTLIGYCRITSDATTISDVIIISSSSTGMLVIICQVFWFDAEAIMPPCYARWKLCYDTTQGIMVEGYRVTIPSRGLILNG